MYWVPYDTEDWFLGLQKISLLLPVPHPYITQSVLFHSLGILFWISSAFWMCMEIHSHVKVCEHFLNCQNTLAWILMTFKNLGNSVAPEFKKSCLFARACHIVTADVCRVARPGSFLLYQTQVSGNNTSQSRKANHFQSSSLEKTLGLEEIVSSWWWRMNQEFLYLDVFLDLC